MTGYLVQKYPNIRGYAYVDNVDVHPLRLGSIRLYTYVHTYMHWCIISCLRVYFQNFHWYGLGV